MSEGPQATGPISLMITDIVMPGMNGPALAQRIKSARPDTKVLYVSGYTGSVRCRHAALPLESDFLQKAYTQDELTGKLREVLDTAP